ncbi:MAG: LTA synthase family protein [Clostridiales Family XIII bacterium]|jgi:hypothetical protein|nr:LTA synthase family protein [Clostridiales Family XIII bacterium]
MAMNKLPAEVKKWIKTDLALIFVLFLLLNPLGLGIVEAVGAQEWFLYHVGDAVEGLSAGTPGGDASYFLATGSYEEQEKNAYFGAAKGKNLIIVQLESFQNMMVGARYNGAEITPRINRWIQENGSVYFDNFYQQGASGNTSDAEFAVNNSMIGSIESYTYQIYDENYFRGLPVLLSEEGYRSFVMHGYDKTFWNREDMYPAQGFDMFYSEEYYENDAIEGLGGGSIVGVSDAAFYAQSVKYLETERERGLFYGMLISLSSHHPFRVPEELQEIELLPGDEGSTFGNYVHAIHYADKCFGLFMDALKADGLYEESLIIAYGDHQGLALIDDRASLWLGAPYDYDTMMNVPFAFHMPGSQDGARTLHIAGGQTDILPTAAWLLGLETLDTLYLGQNLLTAKEGFVAEKTYMLKGSFIKDNVAFEISRDGIFENSRAWNTETGAPAAMDGLEEDSIRAKRMVETGDFYLKEDVLRKIYLEGKSLEGVLAEMEGRAALPRRIGMAVLVKSRAEQRQRAARQAGRSSPPALIPAELTAWLAAHPEKRILVDTEDTLETLTRFGELNSGRATNRGVVFIQDEAKAKRFAEMQARMIPVIRDLSEWTKVEYLGYSCCILRVEPGDYPEEQLRTFMQTVRPQAVLLPEGNPDPEFLQILRQGEFLYAMDAGGFFGRAGQKLAEIDGIVVNEPFTGVESGAAVIPDAGTTKPDAGTATGPGIQAGPGTATGPGIQVGPGTGGSGT